VVKVTACDNVVCPDEELLFLFYLSVCFLDSDDLNFLITLCNMFFNLYKLCFFSEVAVRVFLMSKYS